MNNEYLFVVDTNLYSGNFERQMCGFVTGHHGENGYPEWGEKSGVNEDHYDFVCEDPKDTIFYSPVTIVSTPGWYNDGSGKHFKINKSGKVPKKYYHAYQSVGIFVSRELTSSEIQRLKIGATRFAKIYDKKLKITGFRFIRRITTEEIDDI